jgi:hypothetical protein
MMNIFIKTSLLTLLFLQGFVACGQSFLNGDFENNTAGIGYDQINLSNAVFNTMMPHTFAFGSYGDMDIINTATYTGGPQKGLWFVAFTGGGTDAISMELSAELIKGKRYTITFWDKCGAGFVTQPFQIGVSDAKDTFGTAVYTCDAMPVVGVWTKRTFSFVSPLSGKYVTVQLSGGANIGDWAQADNFSFGENENSIMTGKISVGPYCACSNIQVPFIATGSFGSSNTFTAQLSDKNGNFRNYTEIGSLQTTVNTGMITCTLPCETETSDKYRIRVVASEPNVTGSDNGYDITIHATTNPILSIKCLPTNVIKQNQMATFRSDLENDGRVISWQWRVNGLLVENTASFSSTTLQDGDVVNLTVEVENICSGIQSIVSNDIEMLVTEPILPRVSIIEITPYGGGKGKLMTFEAEPVNGGDNPVYQWMVNGVKAGTNSPVFSSKHLKDKDKVSLLMISSAEGYEGRKVISNIIEVSFPDPVEKEKLVKEKDKKELKNHASGVLRHKSTLWKKNGRRFVKVRGIVLRNMKKNCPVCYKD